MEVRCINCGRLIKYAPKYNINDWKREVKERDGYKCQRCGEQLSSRRLDAHHKIPVWFIRNTLLKHLEFDIDNGITLCKKCHRQLHGLDGTINEEPKED